MDDYYQKIKDSNFVNRPEGYKLLVKNTAGGLLGLITGGVIGLASKGFGIEHNPLYPSALMTSVYDVVRLVSVDKSRRREAIITKKSKLKLILEDNPGFFAGNVLGYSLTSLIPN